MKEIFLIVGLLVAVLFGMYNCNSEPQKVGTKVLPNGQVVEHYQFMQNGRLHHIYTAKGATVITDNASKQAPVVTVENP